MKPPPQVGAFAVLGWVHLYPRGGTFLKLQPKEAMELVYQLTVAAEGAREYQDRILKRRPAPPMLTPHHVSGKDRASGEREE